MENKVHRAVSWLIIIAHSIIMNYSLLFLSLILILFFGSWYFRFIFLIVYAIGLYIPASNNLWYRKIFRALTSYTEKYIFRQTHYENEPVYSDKSKIMICVHPHGPLLTHFCYSFTRKHFDNFAIAAHTAILYLPFVNILMKLFNYRSIDKTTFLKLMANSENIITFPGGETDIIIHEYERHNIYLQNRKGFIKYALQYGYRLQPCYIFSETSVFQTFSLMSKRKLLEYSLSKNLVLNSLAYLSIFCFGKAYLVPFESDNYASYGEVIQLPKIDNPTDEEIAHWHKIYIKTLLKLFNKGIKKWEKIHGGLKSDKLIIH